MLIKSLPQMSNLQFRTEQKASKAFVTQELTGYLEGQNFEASNIKLAAENEHWASLFKNTVKYILLMKIPILKMRTR